MKRFLLVLQGCFWLNICLLPLSFFIGVMATDPPDSTEFDFWKGFLFIQGIPLIVFVIGFFILVVINNKKILIYNSVVLM
ncbi:hypothetical protein CQ058_27120 [Bacillus sp. MYb56]|uniref:hypothetical protein n=1 Tax=Bacillus TaxID=1386 RepID=UPI00027990C1|nr:MULTISPECIES: hypothetical protein [Bacillus]EJS05848.1 hypothetical protein IKO_02504 [Bacillus cereus VDM034]MBG9689239.1 hypothetical protein [Bacillus mycoides]PRD07152.1 hypothetical protein CQ058_27120 [Bacillus sp. MYb56]QWI22684.1 hypothetical protein EXW34_15575 [Bacillus mycoides]